MPRGDLEWAVEEVRGRQPVLAHFQDYYEGRHRLTFATEKWRDAFGNLFNEFADNLCDDVVDEPTGRLRVLSWSAPRAGDTQAIHDWWRRNRGWARSREVHRNAFRSGDGVAMVWPDSHGVPRLYPQCTDYWAIKYDEDEPDRIEVAAKVWRSGKLWRATLYYGDADGSGLIERYTTKGLGAGGGLPKAQAFLPLEGPMNEQGYSQPAEEVHPWGMPVFHFPTDEVGRYGRSVLADVIPVQDALNKAISDMLVSMEAVAFPQRWATGIQVERDALGREVNPFESGAQKLFWTANDKAAFGAFPESDLSGFLDVQDSFKLEIARKGYLPPYSVNLRGSSASSLPSGIALLVADGRQIKRCTNAQDSWGQTWCELVALAMRMSGAAIDAEDVGITWDELSLRDEKALIETLLLKKELGVSTRRLLLESGYDEEEVQEILDEAEEASQDQQVAAGGFGKLAPAAPGATRTLTEALGVPAPPVPPQGGSAALTA